VAGEVGLRAPSPQDELGLEGGDRLDGGLAAEADVDAEARELVPPVVDDAHELGVAREARGEKRLAAELALPLEEDEGVAELGRDARRLEPAGPSPATTISRGSGRCSNARSP
jgi:hypothetical protein